MLFVRIMQADADGKRLGRKRLIADEGSPDIAALLAWSREHHVRTEVQMLVREEQGPGWSLTWIRPNGQPLRAWRGQPIAREALAVFVDHDDVHVAFHAVRDDGRIVVAGIWDVRVADDGALVRTWSERASRSLAWRRRVRFSAETIQHALEQARTSRTATRPAIPQLSCGRRPRMPSTALATPAVQTATT